MHWALKSKKEPMLTAKKDMPEFQAGQSETQVPIEGISSDEELSSSNFLPLQLNSQLKHNKINSKTVI